MPPGARVFVLAPLGLGDMFVLRGLLAKLAETKTVAFVVKEEYLRHAAGLVADLVAELVPVPGAAPGSCSDLAAGLLAYRTRFATRGYALLPLGNWDGAWAGLHECFAHRFYLQCGLDPALRYAAFGAPPGLAAAAARSRALAARARAAASGRPYVLVHDDAARPLDRARLPPASDRLAVLHVDDPRLRDVSGVDDAGALGDSLFDYVDAISGAAEFHGIDSSFMHMIDHLDLPVRLRVCHAYARETPSSQLFRRTTLAH